MSNTSDLQPDYVKPPMNEGRSNPQPVADRITQPSIALFKLAEELGVTERSVRDCVESLRIEKFHTTVDVAGDRGPRQNIVDAIWEQDAGRVRESLEPRERINHS